MLTLYFISVTSGLSEVVGGLGIEKLQRLMPDIIATAERKDIAPHVRDGYIMMYIYLPTVFQQDFLPYLGDIIPSILTVSTCRLTSRMTSCPVTGKHNFATYCRKFKIIDPIDVSLGFRIVRLQILSD